MLKLSAGQKAANTRKQNKIKAASADLNLNDLKLYNPELIPIKSKVHKAIINALLSPLTPHKSKSGAPNDIIDFHGSNFNIARLLLNEKKWAKSKVIGVEKVEKILALQNLILQHDKQLAKKVELNKPHKVRDMKRFVMLCLEYKRAIGAILYDACATLKTNEKEVMAILYADHLQRGVIAQFTFALMFDEGAAARLEAMIKESGRWEFIYIPNLPAQCYKNGSNNVPTYKEQSFQGEAHTAMCTTLIRKIV